jgi:hypothetical protein
MIAGMSPAASYLRFSIWASIYVCVKLSESGGGLSNLIRDGAVVFWFGGRAIYLVLFNAIAMQKGLAANPVRHGV